MIFQHQSCFDRRVSTTDDQYVFVVVIFAGVQSVGNFFTVIAAVDFQFSRLPLPPNRNHHIPRWELSSVFALNKEILLATFNDLGDLDTFAIFQLAIGDRLFNDLEKVVPVQIGVNVQLADVFNRLWFGVDFLADGKRANGASKFGTLDQNILETTLLTLDGGGDPCGTAPDDDKVQPLGVCRTFEQSGFLHPFDDLSPLIGSHLYQRQAGNITNDKQPFDARFKPGIHDRQDFLRWNGCEIFF